MNESTAVCGQTVFPDDDCCSGQVACGDTATWIHRPSGVMLCDLHEGNARKYAGTIGRWTVGEVEVPYPAGWERLDSTSTAAAPALEVVRFDS
jgi:hypothetical protein